MRHHAGAYEEGARYTYFRVQNKVNYFLSDHKNTGMQKAPFLTWEGLLKAIYGARADSASRCRQWAQNILFVAQMGARIERSMIAPKIQHCSFTFSGFYLIKIASVSAVRHKMSHANSVQDDACVCTNLGEQSTLIQDISRTPKTQFMSIKAKP